MEMQDREQLLNRRFTSNTDTTIDLDYSLQQHNSMNNAHRGIDEMLMTGKSSILQGWLSKISSHSERFRPERSR